MQQNTNGMIRRIEMARDSSTQKTTVKVDNLLKEDKVDQNASLVNNWGHLLHTCHFL